MRHFYRDCRLGGLLVALVALAAVPIDLAGEDMAQAIADFGVTDLPVRSVRTLATTACHAQVRQAMAQGETWPRQAIFVALRCIGADLRGHTTVIEIKTPPESQETAVVTVTATGFLDDAVAGERWRLWLAKKPDGAWTVTRVLWANLCSRLGQRFYAAEPCP